MGFPISHIGCWSERATHASQEFIQIVSPIKWKKLQIGFELAYFLKFSFCISKL